MFTLVLSHRFKWNLRAFLRKHPDLKNTAKRQLIRLQKNPHDPKLHTHKLSGKLKNLLGAWITYEYRVVFFVQKDCIHLLAIGTHDEVY